MFRITPLVLFWYVHPNRFSAKQILKSRRSASKPSWISWNQHSNKISSNPVIKWPGPTKLKPDKSYGFYCNRLPYRTWKVWASALQKESLNFNHGHSLEIWMLSSPPGFIQRNLWSSSLIPSVQNDFDLYIFPSKEELALCILPTVFMFWDGCLGRLFNFSKSKLSVMEMSWVQNNVKYRIWCSVVCYKIGNIDKFDTFLSLCDCTRHFLGVSFNIVLTVKSGT